LGTKAGALTGVTAGGRGTLKQLLFDPMGARPASFQRKYEYNSVFLVYCRNRRRRRRRRRRGMVLFIYLFIESQSLFRNRDLKLGVLRILGR
jgi:hypothetical protein